MGSIPAELWLDQARSRVKGIPLLNVLRGKSIALRAVSLSLKA